MVHILQAVTTRVQQKVSSSNHAHYITICSQENITRALHSQIITVENI